MRYSEERRERIRSERRKARIEKSNKLDSLRDLRLSVNKALRNAGIKHSVTHQSGRIRGISHSTEGWQTESAWWSNTPEIIVTINSANDARRIELTNIAEQALTDFVFSKDRWMSKFTVTERKMNNGLPK